MSTRAGIIIKDSHSEVHFYRHSDGYPEGIMPALEKFMSWVKEDTIRDNAMQAAGWLVIIGAIEYGTLPAFEADKPVYAGARKYGKIETIEAPTDWKAGAFEPTSNVYHHGDLDYVYTLDLEAKTISHKRAK